MSSEKAGWFGYDPEAMRRRRVRAAILALATFSALLGSALVVDRLEGYRSALSRWDMGTAFLYTLPTVALAFATFAVGWRGRLLQSETLATYRVSPEGIERRREGEPPERIPWERIAAVESESVRLQNGDRLPLFVELLRPEHREQLRETGRDKVQR